MDLALTIAFLIVFGLFLTAVVILWAVLRLTGSLFMGFIKGFGGPDLRRRKR